MLVHLGQHSVAIRVHVGAVLGPMLLECATLGIVEPEVAAIGAREDLPLGVERYRKCISTTLTEYLEIARRGMIPPDAMALEVDPLFINSRAFHRRGARGALGAIDPTVRTPGPDDKASRR